MPFAECGAMSEGYIGYHLGKAISKELHINKIKKDCACIITEVEVDKMMKPLIIQQNQLAHSTQKKKPKNK